MSDEQDEHLTRTVSDTRAFEALLDAQAAICTALEAARQTENPIKSVHLLAVRVGQTLAGVTSRLRYIERAGR